MKQSQDVENLQNETIKWEQDISKEEVDERELIKSNYQEPAEIVKYQSQIIDSDEEDIKKDTDKDCKEVEYKVLSAKTQTTTLLQCDLIQQNNVEIEQDFDYLKPLDYEEVLKQSQINFSLNKQSCQNDESIDKSSFRTVIITQVDSEDDEESNEEIADQVNLESGSLSNQESEVTADNRIMMSVMQSKFSKQIQKQFKIQQSLNNQNKSNQLDDIFKSKIVLINKTPVIIREDEIYIRKIRKIQNYFRFVKPYKKQKKQHRYRVNIINELIQTEKNYVNDLNSIREHIQKPLLQLIQCKDHVKFMFNLDSIYHFNFEFLKILLRKEQSVKDQPYAKIMDEISNLLAGFKFYFDYCKDFQASKKMRDHYSSTNQVYQTFFINLLEKQPNFFNNLDIESYLIKPVQRLPKYILLYKDLLKHTNKDHPDYKNIEQCLKLFQQINDKNNSQIKAYLEQLKLIELQNQFRQHLIIVEPNRVFNFEEFCSIYTDKIQNNIILYAFNNLLLFAQNKQNGQQVYIFHLQLTYQSYVKDKENTDYFEHFFEIVNKTESIIIINQDNESKIQLITKIQDIIQKLKEKQINMEKLRKSTSNLVDICDNSKEQNQSNNDYEIKVIIVGTEIRNIKSNPYTVYIIQILIQEYQTKIFVRYSQIVSLQSIVNKYDSNLKVPVLSTLNWFHSIDSKVIDERKLLIEKFLSSVLNSTKYQNTSEYQKQISELLNLNQEFFKIPNKQNQNPQFKLDEEDIRKMILQSQFSPDIQPNLLQSMIMKRKSTVIIQAAKASVQRQSLTIIEQDNSIVIGQDATKQPYFINVNLMDDRTIIIGFKKQTLTLFIKNEVAKFLGLKQWLDFRLFIVDQNQDQRVIDDDEKISSILDAHTQQNTGLINTIKKIFNNQQKFQFIFRKYSYLSWKQEEADYNQDQQRLNYIIHELIWEIRNEKFQYTFNEYCLITALYFYSTKITQDQISSLMYKVIPKNYLKSKKEEVWLKEIVNNINSLQLWLKQMQKEDQLSSNQQNKNSNTSISELAQLLIMNLFKNNSLFGMQQFFVECNKQTIQIIQIHFNIQINSNIFIGLNYNGFHILNPYNKSLIYTCQYEKLSEMKACTTEFSCVIESVKLSFKTQFSFEIKSLILEYKQLQEFTKQIAYGLN
ncbi:unnamed protein product [Paramecium primaurelia]|uniref:DH domain-containing protein n=1 Tax=Paramecium primaurelia TaxID=5886 RepID=A0A8S1LH24_PARPR|nr:unnamed protein product [Paramecium primaurelia]